jgi:hypothetical protein
MSEDEKRMEAASDDKFFLYASDPHRIAAARVQADRKKRGRKHPAGKTGVSPGASASRDWTWAAIVGAAVMCLAAILAAVAFLRGTA